ncbi:Uncharacterised protein [Mycobacteroides abscessus subsp. abscessus]|nr:Uncharacterised protein [Mycobacteroides abscessus subsp. abscessus]
MDEDASPGVAAGEQLAALAAEGLDLGDAEDLVKGVGVGVVGAQAGGVLHATQVDLAVGPGAQRPDGAGGTDHHGGQRHGVRLADAGAGRVVGHVVGPQAAGRTRCGQGRLRVVGTGQGDPGPVTHRRLGTVPTADQRQVRQRQPSDAEVGTLQVDVLPAGVDGRDLAGGDVGDHGAREPTGGGVVEVHVVRRLGPDGQPLAAALQPHHLLVGAGPGGRDGDRAELLRAAVVGGQSSGAQRADVDGGGVGGDGTGVDLTLVGHAELHR